MISTLPGRHYGGKLPASHHIWCTASALQCIRGIAFKNTRSLVSHCLSLFAFLTQPPSFLGLFLWGLRGHLLQAPLLRPSYKGGEGETLKTHFLTLSTPGSFPLLALPLTPESINFLEPSVQGFLKSETIPTSVSSVICLTLNQCTLPWGKMEQG